MVNANATLDIFTDSSGTLTVGTGNTNNGQLNVTGTGSTTIGGVDNGTGSLVIGDGTHATKLQFATNSGGSSQSSLTINSGSSLDIANNHLFINYGSGTDPVSTIRGYLTSGYNGGAWDGPGIDSSAAAANSNYALGYADSADSGNPAGLSSGQIEIKYTLYRGCESRWHGQLGGFWYRRRELRSQRQWMGSR